MNFQENEIEGVHLATLTKDDLAELGVTKIGHKLSIMKLIEQVKSHVTVWHVIWTNLMSHDGKEKKKSDEVLHRKYINCNYIYLITLIN